MPTSKDSLPSAAIDSISIRLNDDASYYLIENDLDGLEFSATLQIFTPLAVLLHHGEIFRGPPSQAPSYGTQAQGIWVYKSKTWAQLGADFPEVPTSAHATDIGPQLPHAYVPFLLKLREIVESKLADELKLERLSSLASAPEFAATWHKLERTYDDFPLLLLYRHFCGMKGVGSTLARSLYQAGFRTVAEIGSAEVSALVSIPGIGGKMTIKIQSAARAASDA